MLYENPFETKETYRITLLNELCVSLVILSTVILAIDDQV